MAKDKTNKNRQPPRPSEMRVTADASDGDLSVTVFPSNSIEDTFTEAQTDAFIDDLVKRNKKALRGLAKL